MTFMLSQKGYTGPGDVTTGWQAWYGLRAFSKAVAATGTQKAINVRRTSDSATMDILILPTGRLDVATLTTFLTSTTGFVTKIYDQSGNGLDVSQTTNSKQPQISLVGGPGTGNPSVQFVGSASQGFAFVALSNAQWATSFVAERTGAFTSFNPVFGAGPGVGGEWSTGFANSANLVYFYGGVSVDTAAGNDNVWHAVQTSWFSAAGGLVVDGAVTSANPGAAAMGQYELGSNTFAGQFLTGSWVESGINTNNFFASSQVIAQALNTNQHGTNGWNF